jgi:LAO/AO transport system kinase
MSAMQHTNNPHVRNTRHQIDVELLVTRVRNGERRALAQALSLLESTRLTDKPLQYHLLSLLAAPTQHSMRIGITGSAGAGKSTLIEALGLVAVQIGRSVAVLATDPAAPSSGGSILGDKIRMVNLSNHPNVFIRPSSNRGRGDALDTHVRERIIACEAAGYDVVIVETVGSGQADTAIAEAVDFVILATLANAGDDIQALKRGVMEYADAVVVTKADLDSVAAQRAVQQIRSVLPLLRSYDDDWQPRVLAVSSVTGEGISNLWEICEEFFSQQRRTLIEERRRQQRIRWLYEALQQELLSRVNERMQRQLDQLESAVAQGTIAPPIAAMNILNQLEILP